MSSVKIAVLISGGGTNLQSIIDNIKSKNIDGEIAVIISNKENAYGLERGRKENIPSIFIDRKKFKSEEDYNIQILEELRQRNIELVVLAGYLKVLSTEFVKTYKNKIINIHPSLIPSFCGDGYYGKKVHRAVLDYGAKISGATVHFVDEGTDTGPIIMQKSVEIANNETVETLQKKILEIENNILAEVVKLYCENRIVLDGRKVTII